MIKFIFAILFSINAFATSVIPDGSISTAKIAAGAVTQVKRASLGQQVSSSSGNFTSTSTSYVDITNLSVSITTTGRPVYIGMIADGTSNIGAIYAQRNGEDVGVDIKFVRGASDAMVTQLKSSLPLSGGYNYTWMPCSSVHYIEAPASGTYTYKVQGKAEVAGSSPVIGFSYCKLIAYEL